MGRCEHGFVRSAIDDGSLRELVSGQSLAESEKSVIERQQKVDGGSAATCPVRQHQPLRCNPQKLPSPPNPSAGMSRRLCGVALELA